MKGQEGVQEGAKMGLRGMLLFKEALEGGGKKTQKAHRCEVISWTEDLERRKEARKGGTGKGGEGNPQHGGILWPALKKNAKKKNAKMPPTATTSIEERAVGKR